MDLKMIESKFATKDLPRVPEFYNGKSIFLTGATGFVGSVLLELLLRCCPGIKMIYILIRKKKNVPTEERTEQIFNKKIFEKIKNETPELLGKVCVLSGDTYLPNLGMNEVDIHLILQEVSVVFHCAASISFNRSLEFVLKSNVLSLNTIIELCRKMKKFEVLVYTSTAYSNSNQKMFTLKEEVYRLPFHAEKFLSALKNEDKEKLKELVSHCKPDWPNWYAFSKNLAENVIADTASDLPVAIIRPSIIISTWKHPIPGYFESRSGIASIFEGIGKGFAKVGKADSSTKLDFVPADIVANAHVLAAWSVGTSRCASTFIVNCTASKNLEVSLFDMAKFVVQMAKENPVSQSFDMPKSSIFVQNEYLYLILKIYYHYFPAIVLDVMFKILKKKSRFYSSYRLYDTLSRDLDFFMNNNFQFDKYNMEDLNKSIHLKDKKDLSLDFRQATFQEMTLSLPKAADFYSWNKDKKSEKESRREILKRHILISGIQAMFLIVCSLFISLMIFFILR